jgi:diaminopimelate decarboxylase
MTVLDVPLPTHQLPLALRSVRRMLPLAGCGLPAGALRDPGVAAWVRAHGSGVSACTGEELELIDECGIRPRHVVLRCTGSEIMTRATALGVARFIVSSDRHVNVLAAQTDRHVCVYLDESAPLVIGERRLEVIGMHTDIDDSAGARGWGAATERLLCRMALMRTCGLSLTRISLAGGSAAVWLTGGAHDLTAAASAIDEALDEGCARWRLPRPAITVAPLRP